MSQPTIKDVAKLAGVSISTVSRVINNSKPVSPESRKRVLDAIDKLDFRPNQLARSLVMRRSEMIGVIVDDIGYTYMAQMIRGIEEIGRMYQYDIMLSSSYGERDIESQIISFLMSKQVEALIVISEQMSMNTIQELNLTRLPYIVLDRYGNLTEAKTVRIDFKKAMKDLLNYIHNKGHVNTCLVHGNTRSEYENEKVEGYIEACKENNITPMTFEVDELVADRGYALGDIFLEKAKVDEISCYLFSEDFLAIGFNNYCYDKGISLPKELSFAGFGDLPMTSYIRPTITTVREPYYDIGAVAMRGLVKILKEEEEIDSVTYLPHHVIERGSVKEI